MAALDFTTPAALAQALACGYYPQESGFWAVDNTLRISTTSASCRFAGATTASSFGAGSPYGVAAPAGISVRVPGIFACAARSQSFGAGSIDTISPRNYGPTGNTPFVPSYSFWS